VRGKEIQLNPGRRVFLLDHDDNFDDIALGGLALSYTDGLLDHDLVPPLIGSHLLFRIRHHLREYRAPMRGLWGSYREAHNQVLAESVLGEERQAWRIVRTKRARQEPYSVTGFRKRLSQLLHIGGGASRRRDLPIGIRCMFALPDWDPAFEESTGLIYLRLGERVMQWHTRSSRGPRPRDPVLWLARRVSRPDLEPLHATRDQLTYAVAHATHVALASGYTYAMKHLMRQVQPPLNDVERNIFQFYHLSTDLLGIPLHAIRRDYLAFISPIADDLLGRRISGAEARRRVQQVLARQGLLKEDALEQDRTRKRRQSARKRAQKQESRLRRLASREFGAV